MPGSSAKASRSTAFTSAGVRRDGVIASPPSPPQRLQPSGQGAALLHRERMAPGRPAQQHPPSGAAADARTARARPPPPPSPGPSGVTSCKARSMGTTFAPASGGSWRMGMIRSNSEAGARGCWMCASSVLPPLARLMAIAALAALRPAAHHHVRPGRLQTVLAGSSPSSVRGHKTGGASDQGALTSTVFSMAPGITASASPPRLGAEARRAVGDPPAGHIARAHRAQPGRG